MRIGVFGGSFNPIHIGHIRVATDIIRISGLDEVWFNCASFPPHKKDILPHYHRYNMLKLALKGYKNLFPCDIDIRNNFLFTVDTLRYLNEYFDRSYEFYFLVGLDAFLEIKTWKDWRHLFDLANFIIFNRTGVTNNLTGLFKSYLELDVTPFDNGSGFFYKDKKILQVRVKSLNISGSEIRDLIRKNIDVSVCVGKEVYEYIEANNLYR